MTITKKVLKKEIILKAKEITRKKNNKDSKFNHKYSADRWEKHGKDRLYINRTNGRNRDSKGYIDLENIDFSNLNLPAGTMYNEFSKMEKKIEELEVQ